MLVRQVKLGFFWILVEKEVLWIYNFEGQTVSSPVYYKDNIYFATTKTLYSIDNLGRENWKSYISPTDTKVPYPCPAIHKRYDLIFCGSKAFRILDGAKVWDFWDVGEVTVEPILTENILYLGGQVEYRSKKKIVLKRGFVTGVYFTPVYGKDNVIKRLESQSIFWVNLSSPVSSNISIANQKLYFMTEDNTLYVYGN